LSQSTFNVAGCGGSHCGTLLDSASVTQVRKLAKLVTSMVRPRIAFRSLRVSPEFRAFVLDQLGRLPQLRAKAMFGGVGLYSGDCFFGIVAADELFFKVHDGNRAEYEAAHSEPFRPVANRSVAMSYWRVPIEVLEDPSELATWARAAIRAAGSAAAKPGRKRTAKPRAKRKPHKGVARRKGR
jgi:DNA transformation protein